jgi:hypothetical protein
MLYSIYIEILEMADIGSSNQRGWLQVIIADQQRWLNSLFY